MLELGDVTVRTDGKVINKKRFTELGIELISVPQMLVELNKQFINIKNIAPKGIYIKGQLNPLHEYSDAITLSNGSVLYVNNMGEFKELLRKEKVVQLLYKKITYSEFRRLEPFLTDNTTPPILIEIILGYLESYIMLFEHMESKFVDKDPLTMTEDILLVETTALAHNTIIEFLILEYEIDPTIHMDFLKNVDNEFNKLLNFITNKYINDTVSLTFTLKNNRIHIIKYASPSSRRMYIALDSLEGKKVGDEDDKYEGY